jgi:CelD/BcsL family acetyltransferase involved in cellulose biosynthesis
VTGVALMGSSERERVESLLRRVEFSMPPFSGAPWLLPWLSLYGRADDESRVATVETHAGALLVPMMIRRARRKGMIWRELRFLGTGDASDDELATEYPDVSVSRITPEQGGCALAGWLANSRGWDLAAFEAVLPGSILAEALAAAGGFARRNGYRYRLTLPRNLEDWLSTRSSATRARFRRTLRQVAERGLRFDPRLPAQEGLALLAQLHQQHWNQRGKPGAFASQRFLQFHRQLLQDNSLGAHVAGLFDGKRPLSLWYGFDVGGTRYYYQSGMDEAASDGLPPGEALHLLMIQDAIASGLAAYDFMRGTDRSWKGRYVSDPDELHDWILPGHSVRGKVLMLWLRGQKQWQRRRAG